MKKILILLLICVNSCFGLEDKKNEFNMFLSEIEFPEISHGTGADSMPENMLKYVVIGNFYKEKYPILYPLEAKDGLNTPFVTMRQMLYFYKSRNYQQILSLMDPVVRKELKDDFLKSIKDPKAIEYYEKTEHFQIISYYFLDNGSILFYLKVNSDTLITLNFVLRDEQWYIAHRKKYTLSQLFYFYFKFKNNDSEKLKIITPPTPSGMLEFLKNQNLIKYYNEIAPIYHWDYIK